MPLPAPKFREIVFQLLYSHDMASPDDAHMLELLAKELAVTKSAVRQAQQRVHLITHQLPEIDNIIGTTSHSYAFERIQSVERNLLRLGVYELFFDESIPPKVVIAEAMRLARKFGTKESASFINAILDSIYKRKLGESIDTAALSKSVENLAKSEEVAQEASKRAKTQTKE